MRKLAEQIVNGELDGVKAEYWVPIEEIDDFYWDWRASGRTLLRSGKWDEEDSYFRASLHRFDANLEYWIRKLTKEKSTNGKVNDPTDLIGFMGGEV